MFHARETVRRLAPMALGLAAVLALVLAVQPRHLGEALARFRPAYLPALLALSLGYYSLQALRWRVLLGIEGVRVSRREALVLNIAGQSTALLPLGELTRALFVSKATGAPLGRVSACVTVQELVYSVLIVAIAVPGSLHLRPAAAGVLLALVGTVGVFVILTVQPLFDRIEKVVGRTPLLRRFRPAIRQLQRDSVALLRRRRTYTTAWVSVLQAGVAVTLFWVSAQSVSGRGVAWQHLAFVYAVVHVASAISLSPGGAGAFELGAAGLLVAVGLPFNVAAAAAIVHRLADKGFGTLLGMLGYLHARRRWGFGEISLLGLRQDAAGRSAAQSGSARRGQGAQPRR